MAYVPNELLSRLTGRSLDSVVLLKWYLQLTFDGPYLNCEVWPTLEFDEGTIRIHPALEELDGPEIAMLGGFDDRAWMCWRPGEDSFEDLL